MREVAIKLKHIIRPMLKSIDGGFLEEDELFDYDWSCRIVNVYNAGSTLYIQKIKDLAEKHDYRVLQEGDTLYISKNGNNIEITCELDYDYTTKGNVPTILITLSDIL